MGNPITVIQSQAEDNCWKTRTSETRKLSGTRKLLRTRKLSRTRKLDSVK